MKLYVIGNGFDLTHGLPTKYSDFIHSDFKRYSKKYEVFRSDDWNQIEQVIGGIMLKKKKSIDELVRSIDADEIAEEIISSYGINDYGRVDYYGYEHEELKELLKCLSNYTKLILRFEEEFKRYLEGSLSYNFDAKEEFVDLFSDKGVFISFNYSKTLEEVYGIKEVKHIHGTLHNSIKIGYNSDISEFNMTIGYLDYPKFEDIVVLSKHDLPDHQSRYEDVTDGDGHFTGEVVPVRERYEFHTEISDDINKKKIIIQSELLRNDKSKFPERITIMDEIKDIQFDEIVVIGHSLGEMDHDFFVEIFSKSPKIRCSYHDKNDLKNKQKIADNKKWEIEFFKV